jgi:hypothetical protein
VKVTLAIVALPRKGFSIRQIPEGAQVSVVIEVLELVKYSRRGGESILYSHNGESDHMT